MSYITTRLRRLNLYIIEDQFYLVPIEIHDIKYIIRKFKPIAQSEINSFIENIFVYKSEHPPHRTE